MKLRLQIATGDNGSTTLEHAGPLVRIGRDPECELSLQGETGRAVSRIHAQIELTPAGAVLTDAGSSNGTLLNDSLIKKPRQVRPGDRIQLGHTGAMLQVLEIELPSAPAPVPPSRTRAPPPGRRRRPPAGAARVHSGPVARLPDQAAAGRRPGPGGCPCRPGCAVGSGQPAPTRREPANQPEPLQSWNQTAGAAESAGAHSSRGPSGGPLRLPAAAGAPACCCSAPETPIRGRCSGRKAPCCPSQTLVSLPGYRSLVALGREALRGQGGSARGAWTDSGVHLGLWGNLPEFAGFPPLLESVVMINLPAADVDLDLILERGRDPHRQPQGRRGGSGSPSLSPRGLGPDPAERQERGFCRIVGPALPVDARPPCKSCAWACSPKGR